MSGVQTILEGDSSSEMQVTRSQYYGNIIEQTKREMAESTTSWKGDLHKVAEFPNIIIENFCLRNKITFAEFMREKKYIKMMLNDPALKYFRTKAGRI